MKILVVSSKTVEGQFLFFTEMDEPYDQEKRDWFRKFARENRLPLAVVESSPGHFHALSFNLYSNPLEVARLQLKVSARFPTCNYPDLLTVLSRHELEANFLRIGIKNGSRPTKLLDWINARSSRKASESHLVLYERLLNVFIPVAQEFKKTSINFYVTTYTNELMK